MDFKIFHIFNQKIKRQLHFHNLFICTFIQIVDMYLHLDLV